MKKFLKFYLPALIILLSVGVLFLVYIEKNHPILIWYLIGRARVHSQIVKSVVIINGREEITAKIFKINSHEFLVYAPDSNETDPVVIINKAKRNYGSTNAGETRYKLIFDRFLFQSDSAYAVVYESGEPGANPNLEITDSRITYTTQKLESDKWFEVRTEIIFEGE